VDQDALYHVDSDLAAAIEYNGVTLPSPITEILATIEGCNDEADWHWIVRLEGGDYAYITGGCDYTGWD
jgi:hypothetical protein